MTDASLETLRSMFPDRDNDTLSSLLVATGGNVEVAIQQLLDGPEGEGAINADEVCTRRRPHTQGQSACTSIGQE